MTYSIWVWSTGLQLHSFLDRYLYLDTGSGGLSWQRAYKRKVVIYIEVCNTTRRASLVKERS
jgi:hypothetical protein